MLSRDTHDGTNLVVAHPLQPHHHQGSVDQAEFSDALMELTDLSGIGTVVLKEVHIHRQRHFRYLTFLLSLLQKTCVQGHPLDPRADLTFFAKTIDAFPHVDQRLLEEVVHFVFVMREHVAHRVDGTLMFPHQLGELLFLIIHFLVVLFTFCPLDAATVMKITGTQYFFEKSFTG